MPFDVGLITRSLQSQFKLFAYADTTRTDVLDLELQDEAGKGENLATPENVAILLRALRRLTNDIQKARNELSDLIPDAGLIGWNLGWIGWNSRLAKYEAEVAKAPAGDRADILWSVTAPLLLGFYGGENSDQPQKPIDAVTPFSLANQFQIAEAWRQERLRLFREDLEKSAKKVVGFGIGGLVIAGGVIAAGAYAFSRMRR